MSEWIEWKGGYCPVDEAALVDIKFRIGTESKQVYAGELAWYHGPYSNDVVAYRLSAQVKSVSALDTQIEGDHYKQFKIQPVEYVHANGLGFCEGNVLKYLARHKNKGGAEDIKKAIHYCELILQLEYGIGGNDGKS